MIYINPLNIYIKNLIFPSRNYIEAMPLFKKLTQNPFQWSNMEFPGFIISLK